MGGGVEAHDRRAPRPAHQIDLADAALLQNVIDRRADVARRGRRIDDRLVVRGRRIHFGRLGRAAIAADIDQINIIAVLRDVIHHRAAAERQVERGLGRVGGAMHIEKDLVGTKVRHAGRMVVADIELNARIGGRDQIAFSVQLQFVSAGRRCEQQTGDARRERGCPDKLRWLLAYDHFSLPEKSLTNAGA
jgi:hypothetical protein